MSVLLGFVAMVCFISSVRSVNANAIRALNFGYISCGLSSLFVCAMGV